MKWVLGTGRCGMHTYTSLNNGWIQSREEWKDACLSKYHKKDYDKAMVDKVILDRSLMKYPCITDCAQFMFIDEIKRIDKTARFVWIQRKKQDCVEAFMERPGEESRIHPVGWDFSYKNKRKLLEWYYDEVNSIIERGLKGAKFEHIWTHDLPKVSDDEIKKLRVYA